MKYLLQLQKEEDKIVSLQKNSIRYFRGAANNVYQITIRLKNLIFLILELPLIVLL